MTGLRIVHLIQGITSGGAAHAMAALAVRQAREGHRVSVVVLFPGVEWEEAALLSENVQVVLPADLAGARIALGAADLVHAHVWNNPDLFELLTGPLPALRLVIWFHVGGRALPQVLPPGLVSRADIAVAACREAYRKLDTLSAGNPLAARLVRPAIKLGDFIGLTPVPHDGVRVGYVGSLDTLKLHTDTALFCRRAMLPGASFMFIGNGSRRAELERQFAADGLTNSISFVGQVRDVRSYLAALDVFFFPLPLGTSVAADLAVMEAMAAGVPPVVLMSNGEYDLIDHGVDGLVATDPDVFVDMLRQIIGDSGLRARLGTAARATARTKFDPDVCWREFSRLYDDVMALPKRPREPLGDREGGAAGALQGADALLFAFGEGGLLAASRSGRGGPAMQADAEIMMNGSVWLGEATGGLRDYLGRYPEDPWLLFWRALELAGRGFPIRALAVLAQSGAAGFPDAERLARYRVILQELARAPTEERGKSFTETLLKHARARV